MRVRVAIVVLALAVGVGVLGWTGHLDPSPDRHRATPSADQSQPCQTSDCEQGEIAPPLDPYVVDRPRVRHVRSWKVAPGVRFKRWDRFDRRGRQRLFLVRIDPSTPGVSLQYGAEKHVPDRATVADLVRRVGGLAGVNGGFFDISDTGAPLGVGVSRRRGFLHAAQYTWNNAFWMGPDGTPHIGTLDLVGRIDEQPQVELTNYNSPRVRVGRIGIYTPRWGETSGLSITDGQRKDIRTVLIDRRRVVANRAGVTDDLPIGSTVLIGRGVGAGVLSQMLPVGSRATVSWQLRQPARLAISGETRLLRHGRVVASDDSILHPRTAVGIDRDTGKILLLVVDGRSSVSRGATLVEMAKLLKDLGAEEALNFDGGGSSTMVAPDRDGHLGVRNTPSDGSARRVGDALVVRYRKP